MMAGILIVYICVIVSWEITCVIFNLGRTSTSVAFFDALDVELGTLSSAERAFVCVEKAGTHVSNFDWRHPHVWSTSEDQIQTVSQSVNSLTPKSVPVGTKNSRSEGFWLAKHKDKNIQTMMVPFSLQRHHGFDGRAYTTPGSLRGRGWTRPSSKGFSRINKLKEKIIYFYSLSVNSASSSAPIVAFHI